MVRSPLFFLLALMVLPLSSQAVQSRLVNACSTACIVFQEDRPNIPSNSFINNNLHYQAANRGASSDAQQNPHVPEYNQAIHRTGKAVAASDFTYTDTCSGGITSFTLITAGADSVQWDFGDLQSGSSNTSTLNNPQHTFSVPGTFVVQCTVYQGGVPELVTHILTIIDTPNPILGSDITSCKGNAFVINLPLPVGATATWQDGSTGSQMLVDKTLTYSVVVDLGGCKGYDTLLAVFNDIPVVSLGGNHSICGDSLFYLDATTPGATYLWQDGSTAPTLLANQNQTYTVTVTVNGCSASDQSFVDVTPNPVFSLGSDTTICKTFSLYLDATNGDPNAFYLWQDGSTNPSFMASDPGTYYVTVSVNGCTGSDEIVIDQQDKPIVFLGDDTIICAGQPVELHAYNYGAAYSWQDGSTDSLYYPKVTGRYYVEVVNHCGIAADTIYVTVNDCACDVFVPNSFTPNSDTKNELFNYKATCTEFTAEISIYNRIGQLVYNSSDPEAGWDGTFNGKPATEGVYIYDLKYRGYDNGKFARVTKRGFVLLMR